MKEILPLINSHLPDALAQIIKADSQILSSKDSAKADHLAIAFDVEGILSGKMAVFYTDAKAVSSRFLTVTIGDPEAATTEEACHEIANQALGLLFGTLSNAGKDLRLRSYGGALSPEEVNTWLDSGEHITSLATDKYGTLNLYYLGASEETSLQEPADSAVEESEDTAVRVMIVDDSPVMCAFLKKVFSEGNYEIVAIAVDGLEAVEKFNDLRPELVTLDIMMPKMKGTDVLKEIMKIDPNTTVVMASSIADAKTVMNCLRMGAKRYIVKPYDKEAVIAAIDKALLVKKDKN